MYEGWAINRALHWATYPGSKSSFSVIGLTEQVGEVTDMFSQVKVPSEPGVAELSMVQKQQNKDFSLNISPLKCCLLC